MSAVLAVRAGKGSARESGFSSARPPKERLVEHGAAQLSTLDLVSQGRGVARVEDRVTKSVEADVEDRAGRSTYLRPSTLPHNP